MQKVLVTAGASGIGLEIVRAFSGAGATVAVVDIDAAALTKLQAGSPGVIAERCDLGELDQIESVVPRVIEALGGLDVLINNGGIAGQTAPVEQVSPAEWDRVMRVNLGGTFNVTRLAIPHLKKSPAGSIINMSSAAGRLGYPQRSAYAASKWGMVGFTKTLSMELGAFGIRANAILPGPVAGERMQRVLEARAAAVAAHWTKNVAAHWSTSRSRVSPNRVRSRRWRCSSRRTRQKPFRDRLLPSTATCTVRCRSSSRTPICESAVLS